MIRVHCDREHNVVIVEFEGHVDAEQARRAYSEVAGALSGCSHGSRFLADFTKVETMEPAVELEVTKTMRLLNERGVKEVFRVLPDSGAAFGFEFLSRLYYAPDVKRFNFRSRQEAEASLARLVS